MPTTLTLKNIPEALHEKLKAAAVSHRRSINSEAIVCLETVLGGKVLPVTERLQRVRALRATISDTRFHPQDIETLKHEGRP